MHNDDLYSAKSHVKTYIKMSPEAPHQPFALCTLPEKNVGRLYRCYFLFIIIKTIFFVYCIFIR